MKSDMGRDKNRGSNNGRIFISEKEPLIPINKDMWINPNALDTLYVKKSSNTDRASTTTVTDDPHLSVALPGNGVFEVYAHLSVQGPTAADFRVNFDLSGGLSALSAYSIGFGAPTTVASMNATDIKTTAYSLGTSIAYGTTPSQFGSIINTFLLETNSSPGTFAVQWAQWVSNASNTTLAASSRLIIRQLAGDVSLLKWYSENDSEWKFMI